MMNRREMLLAPAFIRALRDRPNVLWILGDDLGCELGCYGDRVVRTPNMDRLAGEGARFTRFHTTAPVCSASRSAFNVGLYQTATGTHHHRSHRKDGYRLPAGARPVMDRFREAGYFTANVGEVAPGVRGTGKTDFNFTHAKPFDGTHWNQRGAGQPFFAQINFQAPHKGPAFKAARQRKDLVDPEKVELPPFYPDHPVVRDEVANYLDAVQMLDWQVGVVLEQLQREGLAENTVIMLFGDNGRCLIRGKQWLYNHGTHVPLLMRWPGVVQAGTVREEPCHTLDMNATSLWAAGIDVPEGYHGRPLLGPQAKEREYVLTARDRCDMTVDRIRCVRGRRYSYIRNFMPERPYTQYNQYIETSYPTLGVMKQLHAEGKLNAAQSLFMAERKPAVEFYDLQKDPFEVRNLAAEPGEKRRVAAHAAVLDRWMKETGDRGGEPEDEAARQL
ncbi:MAG: sulfatase [Acidobacteria bacterium]|nr:sulfatase [Acidobacteriota bacterium]